MRTYLVKLVDQYSNLISHCLLIYRDQHVVRWQPPHFGNVSDGFAQDYAEVKSLFWRVRICWVAYLMVMVMVKGGRVWNQFTRCTMARFCWVLAIEAGNAASFSFVDVNMKVKVVARVSTLTLR